MFTREEVERLISDERISKERRVLYALLFLTGMRIGEVAALRWRTHDNSLSPLGRLLVATSFNRKRKTEKSVKTDRPRDVPVHPTLAKVLAAWKLAGWQKLMGQAPTADDLLICAPDGDHLKDNLVYDTFQRDLKLLGLRPRRVHDARRTFISLALADGARKDVLRWITHGPEGDIVSLYTTLPWDALCSEVAKLRIELRAGRLLELRKAANSNSDPGGSGGGLLPPLLPPHRLTEKAQHSHAVECSFGNAQGGTRTRTPCGATPSRWCVYQFHHLGLGCILLSWPTSVNAKPACLRHQYRPPPLS